MARRRALRRLAWACVVLVAVSFLPPVRDRARAAGVLAEALDLPLPRPFAASVARETTALDGVEGDLYLPNRLGRPLLLLPGATPAGRNDRRIVRVARAIARAGRPVFVPELHLYQERLDDEDLDRIARATVALARDSAVGGTVTIIGFSYGGSFGLIAAADPRTRGHVGQVATFGAYVDLAGVIQAVTTGVSLVGDERIPWEPHPDARDLLLGYALDLVPTLERAPLRAAVGGADPGTLGPEARAVYELLVNEDPERTSALAEALHEEARLIFERFSPSAVIDRIEAPVIAMHSTDDPAVPYGEGLRLRALIPDTRFFTVDAFEHVDFRPTSPADWARAFPDLRAAWRFARLALA